MMISLMAYFYFIEARVPTWPPINIVGCERAQKGREPAQDRRRASVATWGPCGVI